jgi:propionyl-CoA carboxylase alpha chain
MPGHVVRVLVEDMAHVDAGQRLLVLEAMKMEHEIVAPAAGVVATLAVAVGDQVEAGQTLSVVSDEE